MYVFTFNNAPHSFYFITDHMSLSLGLEPASINESIQKTADVRCLPYSSFIINFLHNQI